MAYTKRPVKKAPVRRAPKKTSVVKKVATLVRQVKKLNTISYDKVQFSGTPLFNAPVTTPFFQYHCEGLMNAWTPIFGLDSNDVDECNKVYLNSYNMDIRLQQASEADQVFYTMFVVSLKDQGADSSTFDPATGSLQMINGIHYYSSDNGRTMLNPRFFNIIKYKRFYMGGRPGDQSAPSLRDLSVKIIPRQKLVQNPKGNIFGVGGLSFPKDPSQNHWVLLFNDDQSADLQVNRIGIHNVISAAIAN